MAEPVNQSTLKQIAVPAAAAAVVVLLIALLVANSDYARKKPEDTKVVATSDGRISVPVTDSTDAGMADFAAVPGVESQEWKDFSDGLKYQDVVVGDGEVACPAGANVTIHYSGWLTDGKQFDSSRKRGEPATFNLGGLVRGWQIGIPGMKRGGIRRLLIPYQLAYGEEGRPGSIPPKATLIFEIKMLGYNNDPPARGR